MPAEVSDGLTRFRYGKGNMQMHYALSAPPRWKSPELDKVALLHLTPGLDGVSRASNECERGLLPAVPTICVGQPTALDPSRAPEGKAMLWLQLPEAPRVIKGDAAGEIAAPADGRWTDAVREQYADRIEAILASHIDRFPRQRDRAPRLFAGRSRGYEYEPCRRRSLWRVLRPRPVLRLAAVQIVGQSPHPRARPLSHRRLDPSGPGLGGGRVFCWRKSWREASTPRALRMARDAVLSRIVLRKMHQEWPWRSPEVCFTLKISGGRASKPRVAPR